MAVRFHELPVALFPPELQPYIARHNRELRDLFSLEATLKGTTASQRSDRTIARGEAQTVSVTRVEGALELGTGTPADIYPDATGDAGSSTYAAPFDHVHEATAAAPATLVVGQTPSAVGDTSTFAAAAHVHALPTGTPFPGSDTNDAGDSGLFVHSNHQHDIAGSTYLGTSLSGNFLFRDGGNTITGNILPDSDNARVFGSSSKTYQGIWAVGFQHPSACGMATQGANGVAVAAVDSLAGVYVTTLASPNAWRSAVIAQKLVALETVSPLNKLGTATGDYSMNSHRITGCSAAVSSGQPLIHSLNPINHLATATGNYNMGGNAFLNLQGCSSSNGGVLEFMSNITGAAGVVGTRMTWNEGTAESSNEWPFAIAYYDGSSTDDKFKFGFYNQPAATAQSTMFIPVGTGGTEGFTLVCGDDAAANAAVNDTNNCGFTLYPSYQQGSFWFYAGGVPFMKAQKASTDVIFESGWKFNNTTVFACRADDAADGSNNMEPAGSYQFGYYGTIATPASGLHTAWTRGNPPLSSSTDYTTHLAALDYLGHFRSGQFGDAAQAPADGAFKAAGWYEASTASNQTGADCYLCAGPGTGESTVKGDIHLQVPVAGSSGTTVQGLTTVATAYREGNLVAWEIGASSDVGGLEGANSLTNVTEVAGTTAAVLGNQPASVTGNTSVTWLKFYVGTTAHYIPAWT